MSGASTSTRPVRAGRGLLALGVLGVALLAASAVPAAPRRPPNVILILADDAGIETIGAYGGERPTPRIDALAREGVRFENAHATPLCTPSRVRLLTGKMNFRNYRAFGYLDPRASTLASALKRAGYRTAVAGKWQLGGNPLDRVPGATPREAGFDESRVWAGGRDFINDGCQYWGPTLTTNGRRRTWATAFGPDLVHEWALDFIARHRSRPFFLFYSMILPHDPWVVTPVRLDADTRDEKFDAMIAYMDAQIGSLVDALERWSLTEDTLLVFVADNGTHPAITSRRQGAIVRGGKGSTLDAGTHVPLVVRWPGRARAGAVSAELVDLTDVYATLVNAGGAAHAASESDGIDLAPALAAPQAAPRRSSIFLDYAEAWWPLAPVRLAYDGRWKLYADGRLFDVPSDPEEQRPLLRSHSSAEAESARARLAAVLEGMGDRAMTRDDPHFPPGFDPTSLDFDAIRTTLQERNRTCGDPARAAAPTGPATAESAAPRR